MTFKTWRLGVLAVEMALTIPAFAQTPTPTPLTVDQTVVSIRVDGHLDDWPSARMILLNQKNQVTIGKNFWKGELDFSGRVFITYDAQYLYLGAIVRKQGAVVNPNEKASLWNGDCLELFLSVHPKSKVGKRLSAGEYHIGFSPGSGYKNPQIYCFNKESDILGGRVVARPAKTGYVMEACVPLSFFEGLDMGPGKTCAFNLALDEGGPISGNRIVQLDYTGKPFSGEHPVDWAEIQWIGKTEVSIPVEKREDMNARLVADGTKGANYLGMKTLQGKVTDPTGKPLAGARVSTWPKTKDTVTDATGNFMFDHVKVYDKTFLCSRADGYAGSVCALPAKGAPAAVHLWPLPKSLVSAEQSGTKLLWGETLKLPADGNLEKMTTGTLEAMKSLGLKILRLTGLESTAESEAIYPILDKFVAYAKEIGAEPMIEVPLSSDHPVNSSNWVRYCNVEKKYNVRYWTVGDEPDSGSSYSAYDYINDFRADYIAMKSVDPSLFILGPELASKYLEGEDDWLTPFVQYNGDILDMVSVHHYASLKAADCSRKAQQADIRSEASLLRNLNDKISSHADGFIPLAITGMNVCSEAVSDGAVDSAGPQSFWAVLWTADALGIALNEHLGLCLFSYLKNVNPSEFWGASSPKPTYWAMKLFGELAPANPIPAQIQQADMSVYAGQNPKTKDVTLLIINGSDRYWRPKILLGGKDADLMVEAGLDQRVDYEIPAFSISLLKIRSDKTPGEAVVYNRKLFEAGKEPVTSVLKPW